MDVGFSFNLWNNKISDIRPLANLTNLTELSITNNQVTDITPLASLTKLNSLGIGTNQITNVLSEEYLYISLF